MPQSVSVPEKTLEHWSSQYLTYRYRSKAALWWPTSREDIDVRWLPMRPGKAVQIELKTTTLAGAGLHDVLVDLGQLWEYRQRPIWQQPFYAFPWPDWPGNLTAVAIANGRPVTELGFGRSGPGWWFADWMVVLTAAQVAGVLYKELLAHGCPKRGSKRRLVRLDLSRSLSNPVVTWGSGATWPQFVRWRDFWTELEQCGRVGWPQLIRLPAWCTRVQGHLPRLKVAGLLREAASMIEMGEWDDDEQLVTLVPDADGNYDLAPDPGLNPDEPHADRADEIPDHRQVVFLEARALLSRRYGRSRR